MRTPSSALPAWPQGLVEGRGRALPDFLLFSFTVFFAAFLVPGRAFGAFPLGFDFLLVAIGRFLSNDDAGLFHFNFLRMALCGLSLPILPLSLPAAGSMAAFTNVGLPESIASLTARLSSSGVVTCTPAPPNASISFS